ncbi:MAG: type II toxin-antitoxin system PemK/MazF family toxin [Actinobacteria bacterium]|nr:type II toxin-antitoxin system PemK/MazF family toxin [Actinomycetota bacterium]
MTEPARGEVWWGEAPDAKGRPYLVLTRDETIPVLRTVVVAPVTRTMRQIPSEISLGKAEGLPTECAATMDSVITFPKSMLVRRMGELTVARRPELCGAVAAAFDC